MAIATGTALALGAGALTAGASAMGASKTAKAQKQASDTAAEAANPQWLRDANEANYNTALGVSQQPYTPYFDTEKYLFDNPDVAASGMSAIDHYKNYGQKEGRSITELDKVAPLNQNQNSAYSLAGSQVGRFDEDYGKISGLLDGATTPYGKTYDPTAVTARDVGTTKWTEADQGAYMNPFLEMAMQPQIDAAKQDYAIRQNQANAKAAGSSSFGGSRAGINQAIITGQEQDKLNAIRGTGYKDAYDTGLTAFNQDANRDLSAQTSNQAKDVSLGKYNEDQILNAFKTNYSVFDQDRDAALNSAQQQQALVNTKNNVTNGIIDNLSSTGATQQANQQAITDADVARFMEENGYPREMTAYISSILTGNTTHAMPAQTPVQQNSAAQSIGTGLQVGGMVGDLYNKYQSQPISGSTGSETIGGDLSGDTIWMG